MLEYKFLGEPSPSACRAKGALHGAKVRIPYFRRMPTMLAMLTAKNQLTLPKSIPGPCRYPAFAKKRVVLRPSLAARVPACKPGPLSGLAACGSKAPRRPPASLQLAGEGGTPGPLSRLRERVGVRVFGCRHDSVPHEHHGCHRRCGVLRCRSAHGADHPDPRSASSAAMHCAPSWRNWISVKPTWLQPSPGRASGAEAASCRVLTHSCRW